MSIKDEFCETQPLKGKIRGSNNGDNDVCKHENKGYYEFILLVRI